MPPYCPELNPVENVWQYLRANWLAISVFDTYEAIVEACCKAWNRFEGEPAIITSIASRCSAVGITPASRSRLAIQVHDGIKPWEFGGVRQITRGIIEPADRPITDVRPGDLVLPSDAEKL